MPMRKNLYVLGYPVSHSKSPAMYNAVYPRLGLRWHYDLMACATEEEARSFVANGDYISLNVTMPYKPLALQMATARAASARLAAGANVLVRKGEALIAYNTDGQGCTGYLERCGFSFAGKRVAVCGTGPTSLSILHAAAQAGASEVVLLSRDKARSESAMRAYVSEYGRLAGATMDFPPAREHHLSFRQAYDRVAFKFGSYETSRSTIAGADLIVDATPLGMMPNDPAPFDVDLLSEGQWVFDVVYGHGETALSFAAKDRGCVFRDGQGMLVGQAVATVGIVCDIAGVEVSMADEEMFAIMAAAAGFDCADDAAVD